MNRRAPVYVTRKVRFSASHRYHNPQWSDEENREVFGACNNPWGHGHNYELEVTLAGEPDPETGMVLNLTEIDAILRRTVLELFDHRYINREVPGFETAIPTTENLALYIWDLIAPLFADTPATLFRVRLWESPELYAECYADCEIPAP